MQPIAPPQNPCDLNLSDVIPHIGIYEEATQITAQKWIKKVIYESFVFTADQDYLTARFLALNGLSRGFFWGAAQASEKYLKALLLLHSIDIRELSRKHDILKIFDLAKATDHRLSQINVAPHTCISNASGSRAVMEKFDLRNLLSELHKHGHSANRYNANGTTFNTGHLFALDSFVHGVRRLLEMPNISESYKKLSKELIESFQTANPWFSSTNPITLPSDEISLRFTGSVTSLEILNQNSKIIEFEIALEWLKQKMKI